MYIGRDFKRDIELDNSKIYASNLRPNRSWLDLFSLSLSNCFNINYIDFTNLIDNLSEDEVVILNSHDDIFKWYQINYWSKDRISDILMAIKCPSFKSETKIFKSSEMLKMGEFIYNQNHTKSIIIKNVDENLFINLVYGDTVKITPKTLYTDQQTNFLDKLKERYKLWEIGDCACKPKKIRVQTDNFENLHHTIDQLKWISSIIDVELGMYIRYKYYDRLFTKYDTIRFNHSNSWKSYTNLIFTGNALAAVADGNYYNFRLDQRTKEFENSHIGGRI